MADMSGWAGVGALHAAAHPDSKLAKQLAAAAAKKSKTPAEKLATSIKRAEKERANKLSWAAECRERAAEHEEPATAARAIEEAERWEGYAVELEIWIKQQKKNLAEL